MRKFRKFSDLENKDFPAFLTVRNFIMMIDSTLKYPFFSEANNEAD